MIKIGDTLKLSERGTAGDWEYARLRGWDEHSRFIALSPMPHHPCELLAVFELDRMRRSPAMHYAWRFEVADEP